MRQQLGDAIAYAYAAAGGTRVFSDNEVSRDIAEREFQKAMTEAVNRPVTAPLLIAGPDGRIAAMASTIAAKLAMPNQKKLKAVP